MRTLAMVLMVLATACGAPPCAQTCKGCCTLAGQCQLGTTQDQCGAQGLVCSACITGSLCQVGACVSSSGSGGGGGGGSTQLRVFITSTAYPSDLKTAGAGLDGLDGADKLCNRVASAGNKPGRWKAWLSSSTTSALSRITSSGPWFQSKSDGSMIKTFNNKDNLSTIPLTPMTINENGVDLVSSSGYWTGTALGGLSSGFTCLDWTANSTPERGTIGNVLSSGSGWTDQGTTYCRSDNAGALLCLEL